MEPVQITSTVAAGPGQPLLLIAGPCQIESYDHCLMIAGRLAEICAKTGVNLIFKSSYDKANRTSLSGARGPGLAEGLEILARVRAATGVPVITDVHTPDQAPAAAQAVDLLQIPAFLCRQTDLLTAAAAQGKPVMIKKGQFLAPEDMRFAAEKAASTGNRRILLCERGSCFGHRDLVVDMRSLVIMGSLGYPTVFDATHSVQLMGGAGGSSGGQRAFITPLMRAAVATGVDGLFIETHDSPDRAPSDGAVMLPLDEMPRVVESARRLHQLRREID